MSKRIANLTKSLKRLKISRMERPTINKISDICVPVDQPPFSRTEDMAYENLFGSRKQREHVQYTALALHQKDLLRRLSISEIVGSNNFRPPFPDVSPASRKIQQLISILNKYQFVLIAEHHCDGNKELEKPLVKKYQRRSALKGGVVRIVDDEQHLSAALWAVDKEDPLDYWRGGGILELQVDQLFSGKKLIVFGLGKESVTAGGLESLFRKSDEEWTPLMAVINSNFIGGSEQFNHVIEHINAPWKLQEEETEVMGGVLTELAHHDLTKGSLGPGQRLYLVNSQQQSSSSNIASKSI